METIKTEEGYHTFMNFRGEQLIYKGQHWSHWPNKNAGTLPKGCQLIATIKRPNE